MEYKKNNSAKWKAIRHLLQEPPEKFDHKHVDPEGRSKADIPRAKDGTILFEDSSNYQPMNLDSDVEHMEDGHDGEAQMAEKENPEEMFDGVPMQDDEDKVVDMFGDFDEEAESKMVDCLVIAGLTPEAARPVAKSTDRHIH